MALRPVSELGLTDATDLETPVQAAEGAEPPGVASSVVEPTVVERPRATARPKRRVARAARKPVSEARQATRPAIGLADEPTTFLQVMVPGEIHERLTEVSHRLGADHRKLRHQKTILAALIWRHVVPGDADGLRGLASLLDAYLQTDVSEAPVEVKVGAHMPFSLKYGLDGAALALRRTGRAASAKTLLSALIWRHVDVEGLDELVELLTAYREAARPQPTPLG